MDPWQVVLDKLLQEQGGCDGPAPSATSVQSVCQLALQLVYVAVLQRHAPDLLTRGLRRGRHAVSKLVVVAPHAGNLLAQRHHAGAGKRGDVNDLLHSLILAVQHGVGERQTALSISVVDLDSGAVHAGDDVTGVEHVDVAADHVLAGGDDEVNLHAVGLQLGDGRCCAKSCCSAAHVELHLGDHAASAHLHVVAAAVEGQALAHDADLALHLSLGLVGEVDELRGQVCGGSDAEVKAHPHLLALLLVKDLRGHLASSKLAGEIFCGRRHRLWREVVGGGVDQLPGEADP
mmetsp:Transcript_34336/g.80354  ORF Transcript_34336/g.80354 Transcript_34336/m.80354 type:complete len:290 (+) Transcript_34336:255-1124(+)